MIIHKQTSISAGILLGMLTLGFLPAVGNVETAPHLSLKNMTASFTPRKTAIAGSIIASILYVMMKTKKTNYDSSMKYFKRDLNAIIIALKNGDIKGAAHLMKAFFDDYIVGRELKIQEINFSEKKEDGTVIKVKDTRLKCLPFGLMGLFDAYVIKQVKALIDNHSNLIIAAVALSNFMAWGEIPGVKLPVVLKTN